MYAVMALVGFMLLTWAAAIWASFQDEFQPPSKIKAQRRRLKTV